MNSRRMIFFGLTIALAAAWLVFLYLPTLKDQQQLLSKIIEQRSQLDDFNLTMAQLPGFIETNERLKVRLQEASSHLYAKDDLLTLFHEIELTANRAGLDLLEITPPINELLELNRTTPGTAEPQFLNITLTFSGGFLAFGRFVEEVERQTYFRSVTSCASRAATDGSGQTTHSLGFKALLGSAAEEL